MKKINCIITGIGGYVPEYILTNEELSRMVDTNDEWIMTRVGIKERHILTEEGLGTSYMARKAAKQLIQKTGADPDTIDAVIVATTTADYKFPSTRTEECVRVRLLGCMLWIPLFARRGFNDDSERPIQEDHPHRCRQDVISH